MCNHVARTRPGRGPDRARNSNHSDGRQQLAAAPPLTSSTPDELICCPSGSSSSLQAQQTLNMTCDTSTATPRQWG